MNIIYKRLEPQHSGQYRVIRLQSLQSNPEAFGSTYEEEAAVEKLFFEKCIEDKNEEYFVIGAFIEEKLIGICAVVRNKFLKTRHRAELIQVFVSPEHTGKNIATNLLLATISEAKKINGIEQLELGVSTVNKPAIAAYRKVGFNETGTSKRCLKVNGKYIDELLMVLFL